MHHRPSVFKACVFLFAASASLAGVVQAADSKLDNVLKRGHLIVGTGSTNAPWHFQGADGKLQGFDIDIGRIVAKGLLNQIDKYFGETRRYASICNLFATQGPIWR